MDQTQSFDLVGSPLMIAGIGTAFGVTINYRVHDGHDEVTGFITVSRPVLLNTRMVKGSYIGYREHVVKRGDMLSKIAEDNLGRPDFERLVHANAHVINDPKRILPGQLIPIPIGSRDG